MKIDSVLSKGKRNPVYQQNDKRDISCYFS